MLLVCLESLEHDCLKLRANGEKMNRFARLQAGSHPGHYASLLQSEPLEWILPSLCFFVPPATHSESHTVSAVGPDLG